MGDEKDRLHKALDAIYGDNCIDTSSTVFKRGTNKMQLFCKKHQHPFEQHWKSIKAGGCLCKFCAGRAIDTDTFVYKAKKVHGDTKYDYSMVEWAGSKVKVKLCCPTHGTFEQTPHDHIQGKGCPTCAGKGVNTETFIRKVLDVFPEYDYSKVVYKTMNTKIIVVCPYHSEFLARPSTLLNGHGCPKCAGSARLTTLEFIHNAVGVHGPNKFDYSKVEYVNNKTKVIIACNTCNTEFRQVPTNHTRGIGCPNCAHSKPKDTKSFISEALSIHGSKYNYSNVEYTGCFNKVEIDCNSCGSSFFQAPSKHLSGQGCPECVSTRATSVYIMKVGDNFKLGISTNPQLRTTEISRSSGEYCTISFSKQLPSRSRAFEIEQLLHKKYQHLRTYPGPRQFDGSTEIFNLSEEQVQEVIQYLESL